KDRQDLGGGAEKFKKLHTIITLKPDGDLRRDLSDAFCKDTRVERQVGSRPEGLRVRTEQ
ncbi:hypothetical protein, partial [Acidithiobacillus thiooxidans]|uniref:hypothetical protein n=1 Tax=Acidithiobacillus thiooxidans TaxID=930 RepID=UPI001C071D40